MPALSEYRKKRKRERLSSLPLVRNLKHPACVASVERLDDLQISTLAKLFHKHSHLHDADPVRFGIALFQEVIDPLQRSREFSYTDDKINDDLPVAYASQEDVDFVLASFSARRCGLLPFNEILEKNVLSHFLECEAKDVKGYRVVKPAIHNCLFCLCEDDSKPADAAASMPQRLTCTAKRQGGSASFKGGLAWSYDMDTGARSAVLCQSKCPQCRSTYDLQTFTPGPGMKAKIGMCSVSHCDRLPPGRCNMSRRQPADKVYHDACMKCIDNASGRLVLFPRGQGLIHV